MLFREGITQQGLRPTECSDLKLLRETELPNSNDVTLLSETRRNVGTERLRQ